LTITGAPAYVALAADMESLLLVLNSTAIFISCSFMNALNAEIIDDVCAIGVKM